jgi:two-component system, OmpR family, alkaline phosphatase synthesis response regulator PhoP
LEELLLRVAKLVQRGGSKVTTTVLESYTFGENHVDFQSYEVRGQGGLVKTLSQREMMLLRLLVERQGEVVSREEILQKVWGYNVFPTTRTVDNFIVGFRKYFEPDPREPRHFHSIRGVGYKFTL